MITPRGIASAEKLLARPHRLFRMRRFRPSEPAAAFAPRTRCQHSRTAIYEYLPILSPIRQRGHCWDITLSTSRCLMRSRKPLTAAMPAAIDIRRAVIGQCPNAPHIAARATWAACWPRARTQNAELYVAADSGARQLASRSAHEMPWPTASSPA